MAKGNPIVYSSGESGGNRPFKSLESLKKTIAGGSEEEIIERGVGAEINKNSESLEKEKRPDPRQEVFKKRVQETLPEIFNAEAIEEAINTNIASERKADKARKIVGLVKNDLNSVAENPEWYQLKWQDNELKNALKKHFIKRTAHYFNTEKLMGAKKFYNYLERLCKEESTGDKLRTAIEDFDHARELTEFWKSETVQKIKQGNFDIGDLEKLKINPEIYRAIKWDDFSKKQMENIRKATQAANKIIEKELRKHPLSGEKKKFLDDFRKELEKRILEKLSKKEEKDLGQDTAKKFVNLRRVTPLAKEAIFAIREAFQKDENLKREDLVKLLKGRGAKWEYLSPGERDLVMTDFERLEREKKNKSQTPQPKPEREIEEEIPEKKKERTREDVIAGIKAAAEVGDEEVMEKLEEELENFDKTGEQLFEEAQALEATKKAREAADLATAERRQREISEVFPKEETTEQKIRRSMEEVERERQKRADEKIKEFFSKKTEEIEQPERPLYLEQLRLEVEQARKDYLEIDYKKKKAWKRLYDFFGSVFQGRKEDDKEVTYYRGIYDSKLFDYKNALLADAKARGASNKELGDLVRLFGAEVNCNLADVRDQVKMENQEGKLLGFFMKHSKNIINWYDKLPRYKKRAIGVAFGLTASAGVAFGGAAVAGAMGIAVSARRVFLGAVTGTGVALGTEAFLRRRTEKAIESDAKAITKQFEKYENLSLEEKLELVDEKVKMLIGDVDKKIARHKKTKLAAASLGILAGTVIGSGIAAELFGEGFKKAAGLAQKVAEHFGYHLEAPVPIGGTRTPEVKPVKIVFEKGDNLEKLIAEHFKNNPELIEKYNLAHGNRNFNPGQIAHRLYGDYLHENKNPLNRSLDLVYPGAEVEIDPAALRISEFSDTKGAIGRAIEQVAGSHDQWAGMKNLSLKELAGAAKNKIMDLSGEYERFWGPEAEIKSSEKIKDWIARVVRLAAEKK